MDPPREPGKPRKRDRIKMFFSRPPSRTPRTFAGGLGTSSQVAYDAAILTPPAENTTRSEIQSNQGGIDTAIGCQPRQDLTSQSTSSEAMPSLPARNEGITVIPSTSAFDHDVASRVSKPSPPRGRLARLRGERKPQITTAHVDHPSQALGTTFVEADPSDLPIQSNRPAAATSHGANEPQDGPAHVDHQPAGLGSKIYEGVKTTLRRIVDVSDVFPPIEEYGCRAVGHLQYD
ncbi:hypothetical protein H1R20_g13347, partial [Candolleomyces eurysporus]